MTVNYKGTETNFNYRLAEINFNEEETKTLERIIKVMNVKGWSIDIVTNGYASCKLDSLTEYNEFMKEWKECKKSVKLWEKFEI